MKVLSVLFLLTTSLGCSGAPKREVEEISPKSQPASENQVEEKSSQDVAFDMPQRWIVNETKEIESGKVIVVTIPCAALDRTPISANAVLVIISNSESLSAKQYGDIKLQNNHEGFLVLEDYLEGTSWRSVLSRANDGDVPFAIIDRFGSSSNVLIHLRVSFPTIDETSGEWMAATVNEINELLGSLKISGRTDLDKHLVLENKDGLTTLGLK